MGKVSSSMATAGKRGPKVKWTPDNMIEVWVLVEARRIAMHHSVSTACGNVAEVWRRTNMKIAAETVRGIYKKADRLLRADPGKCALARERAEGIAQTIDRHKDRNVVVPVFMRTNHPTAADDGTHAFVTLSKLVASGSNSTTGN
jgi:hypothetical protein